MAGTMIGAYVQQEHGAPDVAKTLGALYDDFLKSIPNKKP
jgi:hypothetical protein